MNKKRNKRKKEIGTCQDCENFLPPFDDLGNGWCANVKRERNFKTGKCNSCAAFIKKSNNFM